MKTLLLLPPTNLDKSYGGLKEFSNPQPSIGIAYIAAALKKAGHAVKVTDAYVHGYSSEEILEEISSFSPDMLGISLLTPSAEVVAEIGRKVKKSFPGLKIALGNLHASIFADELLAEGWADYVVHGEGEETFPELLAHLAAGKDPDGVRGVSYARGGQVFHNPARPLIDDLDSLPYPAWEEFPLDKYSTDPRTEIMRGHNEMQVMASRGCPNQCTFCSSRTEKSMGSRYRPRTPSAFADELVYLREKFGARVFSFMDLAFPLVKEHAIGVCREIISRGLHRDCRWVTECRVKPLDRETLDWMKRAGCARINFGIESGDDAILRSLKKNFTTEDVRSAVRMAHASGIEVDGMFMMGLPGEDAAKIRKTIDFAISLDIRYAIFNLFTPYPGCELFNTLNAQGKIRFKSWAEFVSYPSYGGGTPVYVPDGLTHEELMALQKLAMNKYYMRPKFILSELLRFKPACLKKYYRGLKGLLSGGK